MINEECHFLLLLIRTEIIYPELLTLSTTRGILTLFTNSKLCAKYWMYMHKHMQTHAGEVIHSVVFLTVFIYNLKCHKLTKGRRFKIVYTVKLVFIPDECHAHKFLIKFKSTTGMRKLQARNHQHYPEHQILNN
jgi:hypothetical protein